MISTSTSNTYPSGTLTITTTTGTSTPTGTVTTITPPVFYPGAGYVVEWGAFAPAVESPAPKDLRNAKKRLLRLKKWLENDAT